MQLYALDADKKLTHVLQAKSRHNYYCRECGAPVRLRSGELRQSHFFHLANNPSCLQSGKSLVHIQLQLYVQSLIPTCILEHPFPSIKRIADVLWEEQKIIFEIQCSSMSRLELESRNRDYASLGYTVIWILHDKTFNKRQFTGAEKALIHRPFFHTDMDELGNGVIYDQLDEFEKGFRKSVIKPFPVQLHHIETMPSGKLPHLLHLRRKIWPFHFKGDLVDHPHLFKHKELVKTNPVVNLLKRLYATCLNIALDKACR